MKRFYKFPFYLLALTITVTSYVLVQQTLHADEYFTYEPETDRVHGDLDSASRLILSGSGYETRWLAGPNDIPFRMHTNPLRSRFNVSSRCVDDPGYPPSGLPFCRDYLKGILADECVGNCALNPSCMAYTFVTRPQATGRDYTTFCWLKGSAPRSHTSPNMISGVKYVDSPRSRNWYLLRRNNNNLEGGRDIYRRKYHTEAQCAGICAKREDCVGYKYISCSTTDCLADERQDPVYDNAPLSPFGELQHGRCWLKGLDNNGHPPEFVPLPDSGVNSALKARPLSDLLNSSQIDTIRDIPINRIQIALETSQRVGADTDDPILVELGTRGYGTWLDRNRNDFERGDLYIYDLRLDEKLPNGQRALETIGDISQLRISKEGSDAWCLRSFALLVNKRPLFSKVYNTEEDGCRWFGNGRPSELVLSIGQLWDHTSWHNIGPYESLLVKNPPSPAAPHTDSFDDMKERFAAVMHDVFIEHGWRGPLRLSRQVVRDEFIVVRDTFISGPLLPSPPRRETIEFPFRYESGRYEKQGRILFQFECRNGVVSATQREVAFGTPLAGPGSTHITTDFDQSVIETLRDEVEIAFGYVDENCPNITFDAVDVIGMEAMVSVEFSPAP